MTTKVPVELLSINGGELVLDADGDTSITADTDDQIDFKVGGTDRLSLESDGKLKVTEIAHITSGNLEKTISKLDKMNKLTNMVPRNK